MWHLVTTASKRDPNLDFEPELWVRDDNGQPWGSHRCWMYVEGTDRIDSSRPAIDIVNVANRKDYVVLAVNEGEKEIPIPISTLDLVAI